MIGFQLVTIVILSGLILADLRGLVQGRRSPWLRLARMVVWIAAITLVSAPGLTNILASMLGIGRGTDLMLYLLLLATPIGWFQLQAQHYSVQRKLVSLARSEALRNPIEPQRPNVESSDG